jgi:hypothetical protein
MENKFEPKAPDLKGKVQIKGENGKYPIVGNISLWEHNESKYFLRGNVVIDGKRYFITFQEQTNADMAQTDVRQTGQLPPQWKPQSETTNTANTAQKITVTNAKYKQHSKKCTKHDNNSNRARTHSTRTRKQTNHEKTKTWPTEIQTKTHFPWNPNRIPRSNKSQTNRPMVKQKWHSSTNNGQTNS